MARGVRTNSRGDAARGAASVRGEDRAECQPLFSAVKDVVLSLSDVPVVDP